jgi:hypothetical protein
MLLLAMMPLTSSACLVVTLQPAYDDQSVTFNETLLGQWENAEDGTRATIERGEWRSYKITFTDRTSTRIFQGNLTKIGVSTFLDLTEMRGADPGPFLVPVHGVARITVSDAALEVALLDYDWFIRAMSRRTLGRLSTAVDDRRNAVITATTGELKRWLGQTPRRRVRRAGDLYEEVAAYEMVVARCRRARRLARCPTASTADRAG